MENKEKVNNSADNAKEEKAKENENKKAENKLEDKKVTSKKEIKQDDKKTTKKEDKKEKKTEVKKESKDDKKIESIESSDKKENKVPEARAILKYERISPSKVSIVARLIRDKNAMEALNILKFTNKAGARIIYKLLKSAIANAVNNHYMNEEKLYIHEIYANQGPTLERFRARAKGSGARILKRTSHITIVLRERN